VLGMPVEDKRKFFKAAFKSITLDGYGRGLWRQRSVKAYELSDPLNTFILQHASGMYVPRSRYRTARRDPAGRLAIACRRKVDLKFRRNGPITRRVLRALTLLGDVATDACVGRP
jgi:hypothetical protein